MIALRNWKLFARCDMENIKQFAKLQVSRATLLNGAVLSVNYQGLPRAIINKNTYSEERRFSTSALYSDK